MAVAVAVAVAVVIVCVMHIRSASSQRRGCLPCTQPLTDPFPLASFKKRVLTPLHSLNSLYSFDPRWDKYALAMSLKLLVAAEVRSTLIPTPPLQIPNIANRNPKLKPKP